MFGMTRGTLVPARKRLLAFIARADRGRTDRRQGR